MVFAFAVVTPTNVTIDSISLFVISALHNFIDSPFDLHLIFLSLQVV